MCGIVGYLNKKGNTDAPLGEVLYKMVSGLCRRGPDSAGVALYGRSQENRLRLHGKLGERCDFREEEARLVEVLSQLTRVYESKKINEYQRLIVDNTISPTVLERQIEGVAAHFEVISIGRKLDIIKQVGSPEELNMSYQFRSFLGSHGIGHTRLSTESKVDLSHSQPFWAHGVADLATAHNGHITNYHKLRRQYEQRGIRFYTENDSEVIGKYLALRLSEGMTFEEALRSSLEDFDGSFTYLATTANSLAYVRDRFGFKPLHVVECEDFVAVATEEAALRTWIDPQYESHEAGSNEVSVWQFAEELVAAESNSTG